LSFPLGRLCPANSTLRLFALFVSLFAAIFQSATAAEVTATKLDGSTITGELSGWNDAHVIIKSPEGNQQIAPDQLVSVRKTSPTPAAAPAKDPDSIAELSDGTILPIRSATVAGGKAQLKLNLSVSATSPEADALELPLAQLAAFRFRALDESLAAQWDEIRNLKSANDILIVTKRDGKSLDYVEGVVGDFGADKIEFKLDGESNQVDRAKVAGIIYHHVDRPKTADQHLVVKGHAGLQANAAKAELANGQLMVTTIGGAKLRLPIDAVDLFDFSAGKMLYLSDIAAASQKWTPIVGLPSGLTLAAEYGQPRLDRSAFGGPLTLLIQDKDNQATGALGTPRPFNKGLAIRSRTEMVYRLPPGFNRLVATAGIDPAARASGSVRLSIFADDRPLLETEVSGSSPPQPVDVEITGAKRLKILVDFGQNLDSGDWLNLCDAKIVK
jgi:hypothetical protein